MCHKRTLAMPAIGVCLVAGIVQGCASHWAPPKIPIALADTTALGVDSELPLLSLWPGESRRVVLPVVKSKPGSSRQKVLQGDRRLTLRLDEAANACTVRMDSLATPGDTLDAYYIVSTPTQPPRRSRWRLRVVVEMPTLVVDGFRNETKAPFVGPNPFSPSTMVSYVVSKPGRVTLEIYDVRGARVATLVDSNVGVGFHSMTWNGRDDSGKPVGSGVYFGLLSTTSGVRNYKMTLVR